MERIFEVEDSRFFISIKEIKSMEDVTDDFTTEEELREMLGITTPLNPIYSTHYPQGPKKEVIAEEVAVWRNKIAEGNKSITITDTELVEALERSNREYGCDMSYYSKGLRRVGNRITIHTKVLDNTVKKRDVDRAVQCGMNAFNRSQKFHIEIKYVASDRKAALLAVQKLIEWDAVAAYMKDSQYSLNEHDIAKMKMVWDDPSLIPAETSKDED